MKPVKSPSSLHNWKASGIDHGMYIRIFDLLYVLHFSRRSHEALYKILA